MTSRSSMTTPASRIGRFVTIRARVMIVSPTRTERSTCQSMPMNARTTSGGFGTRQPSPIVNASGRRSGTEASSSARSRVRPSEIATRAEVTVNPGAVDRLLHELRVRVEHVVVAGQPRKDHDVRLGDGPSRRLVLLADLDLVEVAPRESRHGAVG